MHTAGPWTTPGVSLTGESQISPIGHLKHGKNVLAHERVANGYLVASAPDLKAALADVRLRTTQARLAANIGRESATKRVSFLLSELQRIADVAQAAIDKAEGKTVAELV